jgi:hypothetical protein
LPTRFAPERASNENGIPASDRIGHRGAGAVDPVFTISRPVKPEVAVVADRRLPDPGLIDRVEAALASQFTIVRGPSFGAAAVVSVGYQLPRGVTTGAEKGFAVTPEPRSPFIAIAAATAAANALLQARTPIDVRVRTAAARGKTLIVTLRREGVAVSEARLTIEGDDTVEHARLESVAASPGVVTLDVDARIDGSAASPPVNAKLTQNILDERWAVLSFDRRPSWMATFVRRALETDPRFVVTSRVATSRGAPAVTAGDPPAALSTLPSLELFQVVIVGAPEELTGDDEAGLRRFMHDRGGSVVLLLDQPSPDAHSTAFRSLTGVPQWVLREKAEPWGAPSASAVLTPPALPDWAEAEETSNAETRRDPDRLANICGTRLARCERGARCMAIPRREGPGLCGVLARRGVARRRGGVRARCSYRPRPDVRA